MKLIIAAVTAYFLFALQSTFWHKLWSKGLSASVAFTKHAVTEGEDASLKEIITNKKSLPLPILHVKFQMGRELVFHDSGNSKITDQNYRSDIFACMPWQEIRRTLEFKCTKRGYYTIKTMDLVSHDLFQTSRFAMSLPVDTSMYVYPRPADPVRLELPLKNLLGQILSKKALLRDPFEMQAIRPYQSYFVMAGGISSGRGLRFSVERLQLNRRSHSLMCLSFRPAAGKKHSDFHLHHRNRLPVHHAWIYQLWSRKRASSGCYGDAVPNRGGYPRRSQPADGRPGRRDSFRPSGHGRTPGDHDSGQPQSGQFRYDSLCTFVHQTAKAVN